MIDYDVLFDSLPESLKEIVIDQSLEEIPEILKEQNNT